MARILATGAWDFRQVRPGLEEDRMYEEHKERKLFLPAVTVNPCNDCWREAVCDAGCEAWHGYYLHRQRRINSFAKRLYRGGAVSPAREVFAYSHPDAVRRYLRVSPCAGCPLEENCGCPCGRYLHWYDARMALARFRAGQRCASTGIRIAQKGECYGYAGVDQGPAAAIRA